MLTYLPPADIIAHPGLRLVLARGVPSPWSQAAKAILEIKRLPYVAAPLEVAGANAEIAAWSGQNSAPVVAWGTEKPINRWLDILLLAERLAPTPALLPADPAQRALVLELSGGLCGEHGLGWWRRLQLVHAGLNGASGFPEPVARYLGKKYGYTPEAGVAAGSRVVEMLGALTARLSAQRAAGTRYLVGDSLTAADIYSATFAAMFRPLPVAQCAMESSTRAAFETCDAATRDALDPILFEHRDAMYRDHLELPLAL